MSYRQKQHWKQAHEALAQAPSRILEGKKISLASSEFTLPQNEMIQLIERHGGKYSYLINEDVDWVLTTREEVRKNMECSVRLGMSKRMAIDCLNESFLFDSILRGNLGNEKDYLLCDSKKRKREEEALKKRKKDQDELEFVYPKPTVIDENRKLIRRVCLDFVSDKWNDPWSSRYGEIVSANEKMYSTIICRYIEGRDEYFIMQLVHGNNYHLHMRWGNRCDAHHKIKMEIFMDIKQAIDRFHTIFEKMTRNSFLDEFIPYKDYYVPITYAKYQEPTFNIPKKAHLVVLPGQIEDNSKEPLEKDGHKKESIESKQGKDDESKQDKDESKQVKDESKQGKDESREANEDKMKEGAGDSKDNQAL